MTSAAEEAFASAARAAADALALPAVGDRWHEASALAGMTVGAAAGHLDGGLDRFEQLLAAPEPTEGPVLGLAAYYGINRIDGDATASDDPIHAMLRDDGARRALAGPGAVLATFLARVARIDDALASVGRDRLVGCRVPGARARFVDYLASRVVELAVHTDDLLVSVGEERAPDGAVADVVLGVALELARARSGDLALVRACFRGERASAVLPVL